MNDVFRRLFGRSNWNPILVLKYRSGAVSWAPGARKGRAPMFDTGVVGVGVWGGTVETYDRGFHEQPVQLCFVGMDIDGANHSDGNAGDRLAERVAAALPCAYVRTSKSGRGAHAFLVLRDPQTFRNKATAQAAAKTFARPYVRTLSRAGIVADKVAVNQLWTWSEGGLQADVQAGVDVVWTLDAAPAEVRAPQTYAGAGVVVDRATLGPRCAQVVDALERAGVIPRDPAGVSTMYRVHVGPVQDALRTLPWAAKYCTVQTAATRPDEPNASLMFSGGRMRLYSFSAGRVVFELPLFA